MSNVATGINQTQSTSRKAKQNNQAKTRRVRPVARVQPNPVMFWGEVIFVGATMGGLTAGLVDTIMGVPGQVPFGMALGVVAVVVALLLVDE